MLLGLINIYFGYLYIYHLCLCHFQMSNFQHLLKTRQKWLETSPLRNPSTTSLATARYEYARTNVHKQHCVGGPAGISYLTTVDEPSNQHGACGASTSMAGLLLPSRIAETGRATDVTDIGCGGFGGSVS